MRRFLVKLVGLVILVILGVSSSFAQDYFGGAQWIGAITRQQAHIPEGRYYQGAVLKESKSLWAKADTLSRRSIILRRSFKPWKTIKKAELRICGLGFYELTINNKKVGDAEFAPLWSDYDKSIFYNLYDVTSYLQLGDNEIRVLLGNGFYNEQGGRYHKLRISFGPPTLKFFLYVIYEDGMRERLLSDENWEWTPSPIVFNSIYGGEDYDARIEPTDWKPVVIQEAPKGLLRKQIAKPVKIMEQFPVKKTLRKDSLMVLDMGQNLAGYPEITVSGKCGLYLKITPAETLTPEGLCNQKQTGRPHYYTYILKGEGKETWHPRFSYYSYRYLQIEGDIKVLKDIKSCFIYNSAQRIGEFECSNPLINDTHKLIDRAIRSNWQVHAVDVFGIAMQQEHAMEQVNHRDGCTSLIIRGEVGQFIVGTKGLALMTSPYSTGNVILLRYDVVVDGIDSFQISLIARQCSHISHTGIHITSTNGMAPSFGLVDYRLVALRIDVLHLRLATIVQQELSLVQVFLFTRQHIETSQGHLCNLMTRNHTSLSVLGTARNN